MKRQRNAVSTNHAHQDWDDFKQSFTKLADHNGDSKGSHSYANVGIGHIACHGRQPKADGHNNRSDNNRRKVLIDKADAGVLYYDAKQYVDKSCRKTPEQRCRQAVVGYCYLNGDNEGEG